MAVGNLNIVLNLSDKASAKLKKFSHKLRRTGQNMKNNGQELTRAITLPLAGIGAMAVKTSADFEKSMNKVAAVSQASAGDFERLKRAARDMGATTVFSASQAAGGLEFLAMAGLSVNEQIEALPSTLNLAAAGNIELSRA